MINDDEKSFQLNKGMARKKYWKEHIIWHDKKVPDFKKWFWNDKSKYTEQAPAML